MMMKCSGCGIVADRGDIVFCGEPMYPNGDPCGSLMFPVEDVLIDETKPAGEEED